MKKTFAILCLLVIGLLALGGCATTESSDAGQPDQLQPDQKQAAPSAEGNIPVPPALPEE